MSNNDEGTEVNEEKSENEEAKNHVPQKEKEIENVNCTTKKDNDKQKDSTVSLANIKVNLKNFSTLTRKSHDSLTAKKSHDSLSAKKSHDSLSAKKSHEQGNIFFFFLADFKILLVQNM